MVSNIEFSATELTVLQHIGEFDDISQLAAIIKKSTSQSHRIIQILNEKGVLNDFKLFSLLYLKLLVLLVKKYPNLVNIFKSKGILILSSVFSPKTVKEISTEALVDVQTVYKALQKARAISLVSKIGKEYVLNAVAWPEAKEFFEELNKQKLSFDERVPTDATIYHNSMKEILFSSQKKLEHPLTAFSAFERFGVKVFPNTNYYYISSDHKEPTKNDVFRHALVIVKKEGEMKKELDLRSLSLLAVFMLKNKIKCDDEIIKRLKQVMGGKKVPSYPSLEEMKEKAELYGVEWS